MRNKYPKYKKASVGGIVDEHILWRIKAMLDSGNLGHLDITYFTDDEKNHIIEVIEAEKISDFSLIKSQDLIFTT